MERDRKPEEKKQTEQIWDTKRTTRPNIRQTEPVGNIIERKPLITNSLAGKNLAISNAMKIQKREGAKNGLIQSLLRRSVELIGGTVKTVISTLLSAALFPFLSLAVTGEDRAEEAVVRALSQDEQEPSTLHLQEETVRLLVERLRRGQNSESALRKVIENVLSEDRRANHDLAQFFLNLVPIIQEAAESTNINITGPVQGLIVNPKESIINQHFDRFLQGNS